MGAWWGYADDGVWADDEVRAGGGGMLMMGCGRMVGVC